MRGRLTSLALALALPACGAVAPPPTVGDDAGVPADAATPPDLAPTCLPGPPDLGSFPDPNCPVAKPDKPDSLDEALTLARLDRCTFGYLPADFALFGVRVNKDPFRLPWFADVQNHAVRSPPFARSLTGQLDVAAASDRPVTRALLVAAQGLGAKVALCHASESIDPAAPLASAVAKVIKDAGGKPDPAALAAASKSVPMDLQAALAQVILAAARANRAYKAFQDPLTADQFDALSRISALLLPSIFGGPNLADQAIWDFLNKQVDPGVLLDGAVQLAWSVEDAKLQRFAGASGFSFDVDTPIGRVVIHDAKNDTVADDGKKILVLLDTGGDDTYRAPVGAVDGAQDQNDPHHVSVAIDLGGKDSYGYTEVPDPFDGKRLPSDDAGRNHPPNNQPFEQVGGPISLSETPRQGGARMGYGLLFDYGQDADHYRSLRMSQGVGILGVGALYDAGGDDVYETEAGAQGAGLFGVGVLLDGGGNDLYKTYTFAMGFGGIRGVGILHDAAGNDQYLADTGDPALGGDTLYVSAQLPCNSPSNVPLAMRQNCANSSFTQGAGFGRRDDVSLRYMSGGLGILRDLAGDDVYTTGVFGEGAGYWYGTGILHDGGGKDSYDGKWYVQGSAAHTALALFLDDGGDDRYNQKLKPSATSIGCGHDFSVAWHIDGGGDDIYRAPGLSMGAGNADGIGVFINLGGNDQYHPAGEPTLGVGNLSGEVDNSPAYVARHTFGIFVDIGGKDVYDVPNSMIKRGDNTTWIDEPKEISPAAQMNEHGAGVDHDQGGVSLP